MFCCVVCEIILKDETSIMWLSTRLFFIKIFITYIHKNNSIFDQFLHRYIKKTREATSKKVSHKRLKQQWNIIWMHMSSVEGKRVL